MPGFGSGPFGRTPFGEWGWAVEMLYNRLSQLERSADEAEGHPLLAHQSGQFPSFDRLRHNIRDFVGLKLPLEVRTQYTDVSTLRLGKVFEERTEPEQRGFTGAINSFLEFTDPTARFDPSTVNKILTLVDSSVDSNNQDVRVSSIVNSTTLRTEPFLSVDAGPLRWELRTVLDPTPNQITVEVRSGSVEGVYPGWILTDGRSDFTVKARRFFSPVPGSKGASYIAREGRDGGIDSLGRLVSATAIFTQRDVGRLLSLSSTTIPENTGRFEILEVVSSTTVILSETLSEEGSGFYWAFLPIAQLDLVTNATPRGLIEQEGFDLEVTGVSTLVSFRARFTDLDVGKLITIRGSTSGNDGVYEVDTVVSPTEVTVTVATLVVEAGPLLWELRLSTALGDFTQVEVRAPSLITHLATEYGLEIDTAETDFRQRAWVQHVTDWMDLKGIVLAYQIVGAITGFDIEVSHLFRVTQDLFLSLPLANRYEVGETAVGRSGDSGSLSAGTGGVVRFSDPDALFVSSDIGRSIRVSGSPPDANDKLYEIATFIDGQTVEFRPADTATLPDARTLDWRLVRLYVDMPPSVTLYDDVNVDALTEATLGAFVVDTYCWEPGFSTTVPISVLSSTQLSISRYLVTASGDFDVVGDVGRWFIEDGNGFRFFLQTVPAPSGPNYSFEIAATQAPSNGVGILDYECVVAATCDYCASNKLLVRITEGTILTDPASAIQGSFRRVLERLTAEVKPIQVELVPVFQGVHAATFAPVVTLET